MFKVPEQRVPVVTSKEIDQNPSNSDLAEVSSDDVKSNEKASKSGTVLLPLPYVEPSWGALPDVFYSLEELKSGVSLRKIPLENRSFYCFGRLDNCHIVMAHPSISRYHAIIQFRSTFSPTDEKKGFYIYDLNSTHGTFVNHQRIVPNTFIKLQVGHIIKFGSSTRMFLLLGPEIDQENESEYSYTELREMRKKRLQEREKNYLEERAKLCAENKTEKEDTGIDWGMGEDADEETDLSENPFAATNNEELYIDDPKKTLRGWFEREGEELVYNVEEKGFGQFQCTIDLPIENSSGMPSTAEVLVSGKKKEAVIQCALEACRILDRNGLLRQSSHESKQRKRKNWEEDDYYDSDEDNFFDRTGELEVKRKQRMLQSSSQTPTVDTYDTLVTKHDNVVKETKEIEEKLERISAATESHKRSASDDCDNLDNYINSLTYSQPLDKIELRKLKNRLKELKNEEIRLQKLVNFTKPLNLPEIKPYVAEEEEVTLAETTKTETNDYKNDRADDVFKIPSNSNSSNLSKNIVVKSKLGSSSRNEKSCEKSMTNIPKEDENGNKKTESTVERKEQFISPNSFKLKQKPQSKNSLQVSKNKTGGPDSDEYSNLIWKPPSNQTGDGRTSLNDKLGY